MKDKIIKHFKSGYLSPPHKISEKEIDILVNNGCVCDNCNKSIFKLSDFPEFKDGSVYCEDCYNEQFTENCCICDDLMDIPTKPEEHRLLVTKELADYLNDEKEESKKIEAGLYTVLKYPYFYGNILSGFEGLMQHNIKLARACDINSIKRKTGCEESESGDICQDCFEIMKAQLKNN